MLPITEINGTCLQGRIISSYSDLVKIFGEPHDFNEDEPKIDVSWCFINELDNIIFTIYNYKDGPSYTGKGKIEDIIRWSVGGHDKRAFDEVNNKIYFNKSISL